MHCATCGASADRACTRCGRFFCPEHGGMRSEWGKMGRRALCARCTPNQSLVFWYPLLILLLFALVVVGGALGYFFVVKPQIDEQQRGLQDFRQRQGVPQ